MSGDPFEALRVALTTKMNTEWSASNLKRVIFGWNRGKLSALPNDPWMRFSYTILTTGNAQVGKGFQRAKGILTLQIFCALNDGDKVWTVIADSFLAIFQNKQFGGVTCYTGAPFPIGESSEEFQVNVKVDFDYDVHS